MKSLIMGALALAAAAPPAAAQSNPTRSATTPPATSLPAQPGAQQGISGLAQGMAVVSSDGVKVAEVAHLYGKIAYGPNETFFTLAPIQVLRRIYGREAFVEDGQVKLRMTAAQFRARNQNPPDWINGMPPRR